MRVDLDPVQEFHASLVGQFALPAAFIVVAIAMIVTAVILFSPEEPIP